MQPQKHVLRKIVHVFARSGQPHQHAEHHAAVLTNNLFKAGCLHR